MQIQDFAPRSSCGRQSEASESQTRSLWKSLWNESALGYHRPWLRNRSCTSGRGRASSARSRTEGKQRGPTPRTAGPEQDPSPGRAGHTPRPAFPSGRDAMLKHKGFPSRLPSTDFQFTIRRANKDGATKLIARERYADRRPADRRADAAFVEALWLYFRGGTVRARQSRCGAAELAVRARGDPGRRPVRP
jgi:hypothetical protein